MNSEILELKFNQEKFFTVNNHPSPLEYSSNESENMLRSFEIDELENQKGTDRLASQKELRTQTESPEIKNNYKNSEQSQHSPENRLPGLEQLERSGPDHRGSPGPEDEKPIQDKKNVSLFESTTGYEYLFGGLYSFLFDFMGRKIGKDMSLEKDEKQELTDATIPFLKKYAETDFKYGEETNFALTLAGIFSKKFYEGNETEEKMEKENDKEKGKEIIQNLVEKQNQDTVAKGLFQMLDEKKEEFKDLKPVEITEIEFHQVKKLLIELSEEKDVDVSHDQAVSFITIIRHLGFSLDGISQAVKRMGGENLRNILKSNI